MSQVVLWVFSSVLIGLITLVLLSGSYVCLYSHNTFEARFTLLDHIRFSACVISIRSFWLTVRIMYYKWSDPICASVWQSYQQCGVLLTLIAILMTLCPEVMLTLNKPTWKEMEVCLHRYVSLHHQTSMFPECVTYTRTLRHIESDGRNKNLLESNQSRQT